MIIGVLGVKGGAIQAPLVVPLLLGSIAFWHYCNVFYGPLSVNLPQEVAAALPAHKVAMDGEFTQVGCGPKGVKPVVRERWWPRRWEEGVVVPPACRETHGCFSGATTRARGASELGS